MCLTELISGCTDPNYLEFNAQANSLNESDCQTIIVYGCTDPAYIGIVLLLTLMMFVWDRIILGCTDLNYLEYDVNANTSDETMCITEVLQGCTDSLYLEYNHLQILMIYLVWYW